MKFTISKEVPYIEYVVHPVDDNGEVDYSRTDEEFGQDMDETREGYWRIEGNNYYESVVDSVPYERIKAYVEYLEGWSETHEADDIITYNEWTRSDEYNELFK